MAINIGKTDKGVRLLVGLLAILAGIVFKSWWGIVGLVLIATAVINWCPIYTLFGINTFMSKSTRKNGN